MKPQIRRARKTQQGMSLVELMISMLILVTGLSALLGLVIMAIGNNGKAKTDTGSTMVAQLVIETIAGKVPIGASLITLQDCVGTNLTVETAAGGGAQLDANGAIDFVNQTNAAVPANYKMLYRSCAANGVQTVYDVRWNIAALNAQSKMVTVSARPASAANADGSRTAIMFERPVMLRTIAVAGN